MDNSDTLTKIIETLQKINERLERIENKLSIDNSSVNKPILTTNKPVENTSSNLINLEGKTKLSFSEKTASNGSSYYFNVLITDEKEVSVFFFNPDYDLVSKLQELQEGAEVIVSGYFTPRGTFNARGVELKNEDYEINV